MSKLDCILIWFTKLAPNVQILKWNREIYLQKKVGIVFILTYIKMRAAGFKLAAACRHHSCCNFVVSVVESISRIYRTLSLREFSTSYSCCAGEGNQKGKDICVFNMGPSPPPTDIPTIIVAFRIPHQERSCPTVKLASLFRKRLQHTVQCMILQVCNVLWDPTIT